MSFKMSSTWAQQPSIFKGTALKTREVLTLDGKLEIEPIFVGDSALQRAARALEPYVTQSHTSVDLVFLSWHILHTWFCPIQLF